MDEVKFRLPRKLPHLEGALNLTGPRGMCFHRAAGLVLDLPPASLAVGTLPAATLAQQLENPEFSPVDFLHAWVEVGDLVLAPSMIEVDRPMSRPWIIKRDIYYEANKPRDIRRMSRVQLRKLSAEFGISSHLLIFTQLKHGAKFGDIILNALGIKFVVTSKGGVLPAPKE